jgi:hypothetical protein
MAAICQKYGHGGLSWQNVSLYFSYLFMQVPKLVFSVMSVSQNPHAESNWQFGVHQMTQLELKHAGGSLR